MYFPCEREDGYFRWGTMEGANDGYFAIRMKSDIITWPKDANGNWTEEKYCREPGTYCGVIFLLSTRNAEPLAFINDGVLQHMRVGGGAGLGVKYLAREDTPYGRHARLGRHGAHLSRGVQVRARHHACARSTARTRSTARRFAEEMSRRLNIEVRAVDSPREAVRGADICRPAPTACSRSTTPNGSRRACT